MTGISFYCFLWRLISVRRVRASNGRQNRFLYRSHRNEQSRKNIVFMRLCGVSGILFSRRGEQIILLFFISKTRLSKVILCKRSVYCRCRYFTSKRNIRTLVFCFAYSVKHFAGKFRFSQNIIIICF